MALTGWTVPELRAAPARVVRALSWRVFATTLHDPRLAEAAASVPHRSSFGSLSDYAAARRRNSDARAALDAVNGVLWPEDDDG
jgi:hypothetical protein